MSTSAREYAILYVGDGSKRSSAIAGGNAITAGPGGGVAISTRTPLVESGPGSAGHGAAASADDHVHPAAGGGGGGGSAIKVVGSSFSAGGVVPIGGAAWQVGSDVTFDGTNKIVVGVDGLYAITANGTIYNAAGAARTYVNLVLDEPNGNDGWDAATSVYAPAGAQPVTLDWSMSEVLNLLAGDTIGLIASWPDGGGAPGVLSQFHITCAQM